MLLSRYKQTNHIRLIEKLSMQQRIVKILLIFLVCSLSLYGQKNRIQPELSMTYPNIYFKHNSLEYAAMPYTVDSCFKYIAVNIKNLYSLDIYRDSAETDQLTNKRIKKLNTDMHKYLSLGRLNIKPAGKAQKFSQLTIYNGSDSTQIQYLLSLNSVFDVSASLMKKKVKLKKFKKKKCHCCLIDVKNGDCTLATFFRVGPTHWFFSR
jgi:hypothetical protein